MKIRLAQINPIVGDLDYNISMIKNILLKSEGYDMVVFPELSITGYPPQDLLKNSRFIGKVQDALEDLLPFVSDSVVIIGYPRQEKQFLYNSAAVIQHGKVIFNHDKVLLPTYDVFDEKRYFSSSGIIKNVEIDIQGEPVTLGIQICEDLWDSDYSVQVTDKMIEQGAEMIINISASPYRKNIFDKRLSLCIDKSINLKYYFIYCNMVGAQDELIFDGRSFIVDNQGKLKSLGKHCNTDVIDFNSSNHDNELEVHINKSEEIFEALCLGVKDYFNKSGFKKAVIGLSGGIDSALTATIAAKSIGYDNVIGVSMPSNFSSEHSKFDAKNLADNLGIEFHTIPIHNLYEKILANLDIFFKGTSTGLAEENLQARIRGNILMSIANKINALVLNTGNKTEMALGYCTMYGDMCGALAVISDINKMEVYSISNWINSSSDCIVIPIESINKRPSAELSKNQYDPFDYEIVSPIVDHIINDQYGVEELIELGYERDLVSDIIDKINRSEYKRRQSPPGLKVSKKSFGVGRRFPIINHYQESK